MPESIVQVTEGSGKKLHTWQRTIGANNVEDEAVYFSEQPLPTYVSIAGSNVSIATADAHVFQLMAGGSLNVYVRRIRVWQTGLATTAAVCQLQLFRLTTAGTGGTTQLIAPFDSADGAAGATVMTLPSSKGTESTAQYGRTAGLLAQNAPTAGGGLGALLLADWDFDKLFRTKHLRIPAGTANGIALKVPTGHAGTTVNFEVVFTEANF